MNSFSARGVQKFQKPEFFKLHSDFDTNEAEILIFQNRNRNHKNRKN